jgi:thiamine biosynthesis lipoprotein
VTTVGSRPAVATFRAIGTYVEVIVADAAALPTAETILRAELAALDSACSRFRGDSDLARVNAAAGRPVQVSALLVEAVQVALAAAAATDGDVDPTLGRALVALGYDRTFDAVARSGPAAIPVTPFRQAWRCVTVDAAAGTVSVPAGTALDLGATAKAFGADRAAEVIAERTGTPVLVNLGGDIATAGPPYPDGWQVRVQEAAGRRGPADPELTINGGGLATSSTSVRSWFRGAQRLHHVIDPATGEPAEPVWQLVSVAAASCVDANIASTAAVVRGVPAIRWLADLGLPARLVDSDGAVHVIAGWPADGEAINGTTDGRAIR